MTRAEILAEHIPNADSLPEEVKVALNRFAVMVYRWQLATGPGGSPEEFRELDDHGEGLYWQAQCELADAVRRALWPPDGVPPKGWAREMREKHSQRA